jgi:hypothetical protein
MMLRTMLAIPSQRRAVTTIVGLFLALSPGLSVTLRAQTSRTASQPAPFAPSQRAPDVPPLYPIRLNTKYGYIDRSGKIVVSPQFDYAWDFHDGMGRVSGGFVDEQGKFIPSQFIPVGNFSEGLAQIEVFAGTKTGYIDKAGKLAIPATWVLGSAAGFNLPYWRWDETEQFSEGLAVVQGADWKFGYIDKTGKTVIPPQFLYARPFSEGLAAVANDQSQFGYIDPRGKVVIRFVYQNVYPGNFSEGLARIRATGEITYVDHQAVPQVILESNLYFAGRDFHDGMTQIAQDNSVAGFLDSRGHLVAAAHYRHATDFSEGFAAVVLEDDTAGYIDASGKIAIPLPKGSFGCQFRGGLARVFEYETAMPEKTTKAGRRYVMAYIDKSGNSVLKTALNTRMPVGWNPRGPDVCD